MFLTRQQAYLAQITQVAITPRHITAMATTLRVATVLAIVAMETNLMAQAITIWDQATIQLEITHMVLVMTIVGIAQLKLVIHHL